MHQFHRYFVTALLWSLQDVVTRVGQIATRCLAAAVRFFHAHTTSRFSLVCEELTYGIR